MRALLRGLVLLSTVTTIIINVLANLLPLNNQTTGEISDRINIFFVPAGYVFSIWGLIYLALLAYSFYQLRPSMKNERLFDRLGFWVVLSNIANSVWIYLWHYNYTLQTVPVMLALLLSLVVIYQIIWNVRYVQGRGMFNASEYWSVRAPFSLYLGWISVATIANISGALYVWGWDGFGIDGVWWGMIMVGVATILSLFMLVKRNDHIYGAVLVWAFIGIAIKFWNTEMIYSYYILGATALLVLVMFVRAVLPKRF